MPRPQILNNERKRISKRDLNTTKIKFYYNHAFLVNSPHPLDDKRFNTFNETIPELLVGLGKYKELLFGSQREFMAFLR